jgi:hypothetical protein
MSASPFARQPLATALAAALLALGVTGAAWASSAASAGPETRTGSSQAER